MGEAPPSGSRVGVALPRIDLPASALDLLSEVRVMRTGLDRYVDRLDRMEADLRVMVAALRGAAKEPAPTLSWRPLGPVAYSLLADWLPIVDSNHWLFRFLALGQGRSSPRRRARFLGP